MTARIEPEFPLNHPASVASPGVDWVTCGFRFAPRYVFLLSKKTIFVGGLLTVGSLFIVPAPFLVGYLLKVTQSVALERKPPENVLTEDNYRHGLIATLLIIAAIIGLLLIFVASLSLYPENILGNGQSEMSGIASFYVLVTTTLFFLGLFCLPLALFATYGVVENISETISLPTLSMLVSRRFLKTGLGSLAVAFVALVIIYISTLTVVLAPFTTFLGLCVVCSYVGRRHPIRYSGPDTEVSDFEEWSQEDPPNTTDSVSAGHADQEPNSAPKQPKSGTYETSNDTTGQTSRRVDSKQEKREWVKSTDHWRAHRTIHEGPVSMYRGELATGEDALLTSVTADIPAHIEKDVERCINQWNGISKNPNIATVLNSGMASQPWVAYQDGHPLPAEVGNLSSQEAISVILDVCEALRTGDLYNITHESLTPRSVIIRQTTPIDAVVADWGVGRVVAEHVQGVFVTPYTPPEQLPGVSLDSDASRSSVYGIGAIAYYIITGSQPFFRADDLQQAIGRGEVKDPTEVAGIPREISDLVLRAMERNPDDRYASAYKMAQEFRNYL